MIKILGQFLPVVVLGGALAAGAAFLWPAVRDFWAIQEQVRVEEERLERGQQAVQQLRDVQRRIEAQQANFAKLGQAVPDDMQLPATYDLVQQLADSSGLILGSIVSQGAGERPGGAQAVRIDVQLTGTYDGLKAFLRAARSSARVFNVDTLAINVGAGEEGSVLGIQASMLVYARPADE